MNVIRALCSILTIERKIMTCALISKNKYFEKALLDYNVKKRHLINNCWRLCETQTRLRRSPQFFLFFAGLSYLSTQPSVWGV